MPEFIGYIKKCPCQWLMYTPTTHLDTCPNKVIDEADDYDDEGED